MAIHNISLLKNSIGFPMSLKKSTNFLEKTGLPEKTSMKSIKHNESGGKLFAIKPPSYILFSLTDSAASS
jgi:hypothetical protein